MPTISLYLRFDGKIARLQRCLRKQHELGQPISQHRQVDVARSQRRDGSIQSTEYAPWRRRFDLGLEVDITNWQASESGYIRHYFALLIDAGVPDL